MKTNYSLTDQTLLSELGKSLLSHRIQTNLTQAELAKQAGIGKRTVERMESGSSVQLSHFLRILRILDLLPLLDSLFVASGPGPMELLKTKGKERHRVSSSVKETPPSKKWSWGEE